MLRARDYRNFAWQSLRGKWGTMATLALIYSLIISACSGASLTGIGGVAAIVMPGPLTLGWAIVSLKVIRGENISVNNYFECFNNFVKAMILYIVNQIFIFLWTLLLIIPGIIKTYAYSLSYYVLKDNPDISTVEARRISVRLMKGNKWRLFCLEFSFIGWYFLSIFTLGILLFWVIPYAHTAIGAFYEDVRANQDNRRDVRRASGGFRGYNNQGGDYGNSKWAE